MAWENPDWLEIRQHMLDNADGTESFSVDGIKSLITDVDAGEAAQKHEVAIHRFLWNPTFNAY